MTEAQPFRRIGLWVDRFATLEEAMARPCEYDLETIINVETDEIWIGGYGEKWERIPRRRPEST